MLAFSSEWGWACSITCIACVSAHAVLCCGVTSWSFQSWGWNISKRWNIWGTHTSVLPDMKLFFQLSVSRVKRLEVSVSSAHSLSTACREPSSSCATLLPLRLDFLCRLLLDFLCRHVAALVAVSFQLCDIRRFEKQIEAKMCRKTSVRWTSDGYHELMWVIDSSSCEATQTDRFVFSSVCWTLSSHLSTHQHVYSRRLVHLFFWTFVQECGWIHGELQKLVSFHCSHGSVTHHKVSCCTMWPQCHWSDSGDEPLLCVYLLPSCTLSYRHSVALCMCVCVCVCVCVLVSVSSLGPFLTETLTVWGPVVLMRTTDWS